MRKTKIICTIGPSSQQEDKLREVMLAGMNRSEERRVGKDVTARCISRWLP